MTHANGHPTTNLIAFIPTKTTTTTTTTATTATTKLRKRVKRVKGRLSTLQKKIYSTFKHSDLEACEDYTLITMFALLCIVCGIWLSWKFILLTSWLLGTDMASNVLGNKIANHWKDQLGDLATRANILEWNSLYTSIDTHPLVGDRSDRYALLRQEVDDIFPIEPQRSLQRVQELQEQRPSYQVVPIPPSNQMISYDIYNCPKQPPRNYPYEWNLLKVLNNWNPDNTTIPPQIYNGLCIFDYQKDFDTAMTYRNAELPFVVVNDPRVAATVERWNQPNYLQNLLADVPHRTVITEGNKVLYAVPPEPDKQKQRRRMRAGKKLRTAPPGWTNPTQNTRMTFQDWLQYANVTDENLLGPNAKHYYYRLIGCGLPHADGSCDKGSSEYLFDELSFFQPKKGDLYLKDIEMQNGIHCRFGMKGVTAENHFDIHRNSIVVLGGSRRYLLSHPKNCNQMTLYPHNHPSARHSQVDWSNPDLNKFPEFASARGNEVILKAGDVLYLPNAWFHHIISLELNYQCNTRSGHGSEYLQDVQECGFPNIH